MTQALKRNRSCNGCYFEHERTCYWFDLIKGGNPKPIPNDTFKTGCSQYNNTFIGYDAGNKLITKIIEVFDGEIIGDKYKPSINRNDSYKKKYTTAHKYTHRRDAQ